MPKYLRGQIAKMANLNAETLRYYEKVGLIPAPDRTLGGYRIYPEKILKRLEFIKYAKESGFTLDEIRQFFSIIDIDLNRMSSVEIIRLIDKKTEEINTRIFELNRMKDILEETKNNLQIKKQCPVIQTLFNSLREQEK